MIRGSVALSFRQLKSILLIPSLPPSTPPPPSHCSLLQPSSSLPIFYCSFKRSPSFSASCVNPSLLNTLPPPPCTNARPLSHNNTSRTSDTRVVVSCLPFENGCLFQDVIVVATALTCLICCCSSQAEESEAKTEADTTRPPL